MEIECTFGEGIPKKSALFRVIGVFSRGVYFSDGENVYLLHDRDCGRIAFGMGVRDFASVAGKSGLTPEQDWDFTGQALERGGVRLIGVRPPAKERERNGDTDTRAAEDALRRGGKGCLAAYYRGGANPSVFGGKIAEYLPLLTEGLQENDGAKIDRAVGALVGLGEGLTPDLDDFFVGALYAFHEKEKPPSFENFAGAVARNMHKTTPISREYLRCALRGGEFERVTDVLRDLQNVEKAEKLIAVGHSSGSGILVGILTALKVIGKLCNSNLSQKTFIC
ncbi:MAG: DUF2877 domain-containing protein [Candidatus Gallimonas sp.]